MMLTGRVYGAEEGHAIGLSQYLVGKGQASAKAIELAAKAVDNASMTNLAVMHAVPRIADQPMTEGLMVAAISPVPTARCMCPGTSRSPPTRIGSLIGSGAMLVVHGTADPVLLVDDTTAWYDAVRAANGGNASSFARFFRVPSMSHSRGGPLQRHRQHRGGADPHLSLRYSLTAFWCDGLPLAHALSAGIWPTVFSARRWAASTHDRAPSCEETCKAPPRPG